MARTAPGKHCREGVSLKGMFKMFPDSATAEAWFIEQRWHGTLTCPECGSVNVQSGCKHKTMPYRCREKEYGKKFSVKTGTVMEGSNLDYQTWHSVAACVDRLSYRGRTCRLVNDRCAASRSGVFYRKGIRYRCIFDKSFLNTRKPTSDESIVIYNCDLRAIMIRF